MTEKTPPTAPAPAKRPRYYPSTAKSTARAREAYRALCASRGGAVPKIH